MQLRPPLTALESLVCTVTACSHLTLQYTTLQYTTLRGWTHRAVRTSAVLVHRTRNASVVCGNSRVSAVWVGVRTAVACTKSFRIKTEKVNTSGYLVSVSS